MSDIHPGAVIMLAQGVQLPYQTCELARYVIRQREGEDIEAALERVLGGRNWYGPRFDVLASALTRPVARAGR